MGQTACSTLEQALNQQASKSKQTLEQLHLNMVKHYQRYQSPRVSHERYIKKEENPEQRTGGRTYSTHLQYTLCGNKTVCTVRTCTSKEGRKGNLSAPVAAGACLALEYSHRLFVHDPQPMSCNLLDCHRAQQQARVGCHCLGKGQEACGAGGWAVEGGWWLIQYMILLREVCGGLSTS